LSRKIVFFTLPFLFFLSLLKPFSYFALLPIFFLMFLLLIRKEPVVFMVLGSLLFILFMNFLQLTSLSILSGFFLSSIFAVRAREADDYEILIFCFVWLLLLSFLAGPLALYSLAVAGILFCTYYNKKLVIPLFIILLVLPISLKNWQWWELIGPKPATQIKYAPVYPRQIDPIMKMAGEGDEGAGTLSGNSTELVPNYILRMDAVLNYLLFIMNLLFLIICLRLIFMTRKIKRRVLNGAVMSIILILSSFVFIYTIVRISQTPLLKEVMVKKEFFRFAVRKSKAVVQIDIKEKQDYYPPVEYLKWNIDTFGRIFGIISLLSFIFLFYGLLRQLLQTKELKNSRKDNFQSFLPSSKIFSLDDYRFLSGSDLLRAGYENFRIFFKLDFNLTPLEFLDKYSNEELSEITKEYIRTEYGMKPTKASDDEIRKWLKLLESFLKDPGA